VSSCRGFSLFTYREYYRTLICEEDFSGTGCDAIMNDSRSYYLNSLVFLIGKKLNALMHLCMFIGVVQKRLLKFASINDAVMSLHHCYMKSIQHEYSL